MFRPPRNIDEAPSPEAIRTVQEAQLRITAVPQVGMAPGVSSTIIVIGVVVVLTLTAFFSRLITSYFLMELVRVPRGVTVKDEKLKTPVYIPYLLPDEYGYEDALYALHRVGFWVKPPLPEEIKNLPMAERLPGLPATALLLVGTESENKLRTPEWLEQVQGLLIRGVRLLIRQWTGVSAQPWYRIPPFFREFLTVQIFGAAGAIAVLALFWRTPRRPGEAESKRISLVNLSEDRVVALLAALLLTIDPLLQGFSGLILTETMFAAMITLLLVVVVQPKFGYWQTAAATGLGVYMVYLRPEAALYVAALLLWRVWQDWPLARIWSPPATLEGAEFAESSELTGPQRKVFGMLPVAVLAVVALAHLPWLARNAGLPDGQMAMSSLTGPTLYDSLGPQANGWSNQEGFRKEAQNAGCRNEWQINQYFKDKTWKALGENPLRLITLIPAKLWATWAPWGSAGGLISGGTKLLIGVWSVLLYGLAAAGVWTLWEAGRKKLALLLLSPAIVVTLVHCIIVGSVRYRIPALPGLELLAAYAVMPLLRRPWAAFTTLTAPATQPVQRI